MANIRTIISGLAFMMIAGLSVYALISSDLDRVTQMEAGIARKKALLERLNSLPKQEEAIRQKLIEFSEAAAEEHLYEGSYSIVQSQIQRDVRQIAEDVDVQIGTVRSLNNTRQAGLISRTSVQMSWVSGYDDLLKFLHRMESWKPFLQVRKMSVRVVKPSDVYTPASLSIVMEVSGYRKREGETE
ncbi:hypothetical protein KFE96_00045 [Kordiimonas sp. SCSIO 12603]|uniref:type II secretion system protein GspM n=1 Tax=Kordiimonas sp. SCSIO 12603 TaxID=2829596 RepID=UPI0021046B76|nr:type II secretion system protein GspM [Kordiimonas sp. SCSIO 12603]UTW58733.1 hypothetical protein KFE96_00045 [Kordiimonas sp. SCSIO 12603]